MSYSYFVADLPCLVCREMSRASINTKVDSEPGDVHLVGSPLDLTVVDMEMSHYAARVPNAGEALRFLEEWSCPRCFSAEWVEVVVDDGVVRSITTVPFNQTTLDRVSFVAGGLDEFYQEKTGESLHVEDEVRPDWPARLRPHLAARPS